MSTTTEPVVEGDSAFQRVAAVQHEERDPLRRAAAQRGLAPRGACAEIRRPEFVDTIEDLDREDQADLAEDLLARVTPSSDPAAPVVCHLDTGVRRTHALLAGSLSAADVHSIVDEFGADLQNHGTAMAGLSLYGPLDDLLLGTMPVVLRHRLESVKILPDTGLNDPLAYGVAMAQATAMPEAVAARRRVFSMPVSTEPDRVGEPTLWSASLDALAAGVDIARSDGDIELLGAPDPGLRHGLQQSGEPLLSAAGGRALRHRREASPGDREPSGARARQGRYRIVDAGLQVKQVWVGEGETRRRFVVCRNLDEARRDEHRRERWLQKIAEELEQVKRKAGEARVQAEAELTTHPSMRRYLTRRHGRLVIDRAKVNADRHLDGKFLLSSSDDELTADQIAIYYKQLIEVEACWRDQKHILDLRPVYHRKQDRIRTHVLLSFLALLLCRVAETRAHDTWRNLRRELERIRLGYFHGSAGRIQHRTELTHRQREIIAAIGAPEPPVILAIEPNTTA